MRKALTTGDVARICQVAPRTAAKWIDSGLLKGDRLPGSKDRRVARDDLVRFVVENGLTHVGLSPLFGDVIVVSRDAELRRRVRDAVESRTRWKVCEAASAFAAGVLASDAVPVALVVDMAIGEDSAVGIGEAVGMIVGCKSIALANEDEADFERTAYDGFFKVLRKPVDLDELVLTIRDGDR